jgi:hypothetical protein
MAKVEWSAASSFGVLEIVMTPVSASMDNPENIYWYCEGESRAAVRCRAVQRLQTHGTKSMSHVRKYENILPHNLPRLKSPRLRGDIANGIDALVDTDATARHPVLW